MPFDVGYQFLQSNLSHLLLCGLDYFLPLNSCLMKPLAMPTHMECGLISTAGQITSSLVGLHISLMYMPIMCIRVCTQCALYIDVCIYSVCHYILSYLIQPKGMIYELTRLLIRRASHSDLSVDDILRNGINGSW